jgi:hypothetical protein
MPGDAERSATRSLAILMFRDRQSGMLGQKIGAPGKLSHSKPERSCEATA